MTGGGKGLTDVDKLYDLAAKLGVVIMPEPPAGHYYKQEPHDPYKKNRGNHAIRKDTKDFVKFYGKVWQELARKRVLSSPEVYLLTMVFPYCEYNTNFLVDRGEPIGVDEIASIIGKDARQVRRILSGLTKKNLIAKVDSGGVFKYAINPELYWRGGDMVKYKGFVTMFYTKQQELKTTADKAREQLKELRVNGRITSILLSAAV